jgi:hypothetical protein
MYHFASKRIVIMKQTHDKFISFLSNYGHLHDTALMFDLSVHFTVVSCRWSKHLLCF